MLGRCVNTASPHTLLTPHHLTHLQSISIDLDLVLHLHVSCSDAASNDHMRVAVIFRTLLQEVEKSGNGRKKCCSSTGSSTCNDGRR